MTDQAERQQEEIVMRKLKCMSNVSNEHEEIIFDGQKIKTPLEPGNYDLFEVISQDGQHMEWVWEKHFGILSRWVKLAIPEECRLISVLCDRGLFEDQLNKGMKPLMEDDFMPVFIGYEPHQGSGQQEENPRS